MLLKFKSIIIFTLVLWGIYDICHLNFVSAAFDVFTIVSTAYSVLQIRKERKAEEFLMSTILFEKVKNNRKVILTMMTKANIVDAVATKTGVTKKAAEAAVNAALEAVTEALKAGDKVQLVGFGTFEAKERPARVARNPRTGEEITIEASKTASFKVGKALKDSLCAVDGI